MLGNSILRRLFYKFTGALKKLLTLIKRCLIILIDDAPVRERFACEKNLNTLNAASFPPCSNRLGFHITLFNSSRSFEENKIMAYSPKINEEKLDKIYNAWKTLAPEKSFGGMTLAEFEVFVNDSMAERAVLSQLEDQMKQVIAARDNSDSIGLAKAQLVVAGVVADPTEGDNSALYEAMGYVRKSNRSSGLTRKKKEAAK